ncbi:hypothetical protein KJ780_02340, partial [Candidatus Micrarchaeota archaeon]|nr:hypothetical protein [Candidatus Micrarchaeota archaeon]
MGPRNLGIECKGVRIEGMRKNGFRGKEPISTDPRRIGRLVYSRDPCERKEGLKHVSGNPKALACIAAGSGPDELTNWALEELGKMVNELQDDNALSVLAMLHPDRYIRDWALIHIQNSCIQRDVAIKSKYEDTAEAAVGLLNNDIEALAIIGCGSKHEVAWFRALEHLKLLYAEDNLAEVAKSKNSAAALVAVGFMRSEWRLSQVILESDDILVLRAAVSKMKNRNILIHTLKNCHNEIAIVDLARKLVGMIYGVNNPDTLWFIYKCLANGK